MKYFPSQGLREEEAPPVHLKRQPYTSNAKSAEANRRPWNAVNLRSQRVLFKLFQPVFYYPKGTFCWLIDIVILGER